MYIRYRNYSRSRIFKLQGKLHISYRNYSTNSWNGKSRPWNISIWLHGNQHRDMAAMQRLMHRT